MMSSRRLVAVAAATFFLTGCAYTTATRVTTANERTIKGIPVFAPKALVVVSATGVASVIVPDCSREYAVQFGTFLAKNDVDLDMANGILTKVGSKQDSTAVPLEFLKSVTETAKLGKSLADGLSAKAEGGTSAFELFSVECDGRGRPRLDPIKLDSTFTAPAASVAAAPPSLPMGQTADPSVKLPGDKKTK